MVKKNLVFKPQSDEGEILRSKCLSSELASPGSALLTLKTYLQRLQMTDDRRQTLFGQHTSKNQILKTTNIYMY